MKGLFTKQIKKQELENIIKDIRDYNKEVDYETVNIVDELFFSHQTNLSNFDIILVLGGKRVHRAITACKLAKKYDKKVLFSGGAYNKKFKTTESLYYRQIALNYGINPDKILIENDSTNTYENFLYSLDIIKKVIEKEVINVLVVSNSIHLPRSLNVGKDIIKNNHFKINLIPCPSDNSKNNKTEWMKHRISRESIAVEIEKIIKYIYNDKLNKKFYALDSKMKELLKENAFPEAAYSITTSNFSLMGICGKNSLLKENKLNDLYNISLIIRPFFIAILFLRTIQSKKIKINNKISFYLKDNHEDIIVADLLNNIDNNLSILLFEQIYKRKIDEIIISEIFMPLEMKKSQIIDGKIFCDINDISKFVKMLLNNGKIKMGIFLEKKYVDMFFEIGLNNKWIISENNNLFIVFDDMYIIKQNDLGIIILTSFLSKKYSNILFDEIKKI